MQHTVNTRFSTTLHVDGRNLFLSAQAGDILDLTEVEAAELAVQVPGAVSVLAETNVAAPVESDELKPLPMKPGATKTAKTRAPAKPKTKQEGNA